MSANAFAAFYQEELAALRKDAYRFGKQYPEMAASLGIHWGNTPDPMVERLVEATAWFAARIRHESHARMPFAAQQILRKIHPHFVCPIPSIGIASLVPVDGFADDHPAGKLLPAGSRFHCADADGGVIHWRTGWAHLLSGAEVFAHRFSGAGDGRRLTLAVRNIGALPSLRLFLRGDPSTTHSLHQWVHTSLLDVEIEDGGTAAEKKPVRLGADALRPGGLSPEDLVLPRDGFTHPAYQLLREYFVAPERFLFWDIDLSRYAARRGEAEISLLLRLPPPESVSLDFLNFDANAVPVVNLHERLAEPIHVDHTRHCWPLETDRALSDAAEVHSILQVEAIAPGGRAFVIPRHGVDCASGGTGGGTAAWRWHERRRQRPTGNGSDVELFFKSLNAEDFRNPFTVSATVLCTDRGRASALGNRIRLDNDDEMEIVSATMERPPTPQYAAPASGDELWNLVSVMTLRHRALSGGDGANALRGILRAFIPGGCRGALAQVDGLAGLECEDTLAPLRATRLLPMGGAAWGHAFTMHLDPGAFTTGSAFLFASVVESFLALFAGVHAFTQLTAYSGGELLRRWPARNGRIRL